MRFRICRVIDLIVFSSLLFLPSFSYYGKFAILKSSITNSRQRIFVAVMPPADLTPAVDKYDSLNNNDDFDTYFMRAQGPEPKGPEPFAYVSSDVQPLSDYVKELVVSENPVLTMAASHFFDQVTGAKLCN
jgi:hypothetical protein